MRQFRGDESYGKHRGIDWMMRYKKYFKNPDAFLQFMNKTVPFLNGGLFECLDDKTQNLYVDGFSDQMTKGEQLVVPDYLFFGATEHVDLSPEYGVKNKATKQAAVKGLINILHSFRTIPSGKKYKKTKPNKQLIRLMKLKILKNEGNACKK